jgi:hypothetical protein
MNGLSKRLARMMAFKNRHSVEPKKRYIEVVGDFTTWPIGLTLWDVFCIGEFTRENVADWLAANFTRRTRFKEDGPVDFHAVCGDIDIPWATKEGFECYSRRNSGHGPTQTDC